MTNSQSQPVNRKVASLGGLFFIGLTVALGIFGVWGLTDTHQQYSAALAANSAILIEDTGITIFYGSAPLLVALFTFGLYGLWIGATGRRSATFDQQWVKPLSGLVVVGFVCLIIGRYAGNTLWSENLQANGYTQCQGGFVLTGKWAVRVWADKPSICFDDELKNKLRSPAHSVAGINDHYESLRNSN